MCISSNFINKLTHCHLLLPMKQKTRSNAEREAVSRAKPARQSSSSTAKTEQIPNDNGPLPDQELNHLRNLHPLTAVCEATKDLIEDAIGEPEGNKQLAKKAVRNFEKQVAALNDSTVTRGIVPQEHWYSDTLITLLAVHPFLRDALGVTPGTNLAPAAKTNLKPVAFTASAEEPDEKLTDKSLTESLAVDTKWKSTTDSSTGGSERISLSPGSSSDASEPYYSHVDLKREKIPLVAAEFEGERHLVDPDALYGMDLIKSAERKKLWRNIDALTPDMLAFLLSDNRMVEGEDLDGDPGGDGEMDVNVNGDDLLQHRRFGL